MHLRFSMASGMAVVSDSEAQLVGKIEDVLIDPDTGKILGFFVYAAMGLQSGILFLPVQDITSWGTVVHVRDSDVLAPPEDIIRLQDALHDGRRVLGQRIVTETEKTVVGRCADVQFSTKHFLIEWLFPRKFFVTRTPIPASEIIEVTQEAIIIKEPLREKTEPAKSVVDTTVETLKEVAPTVS